MTATVSNTLLAQDLRPAMVLKGLLQSRGDRYDSYLSLIYQYILSLSFPVRGVEKDRISTLSQNPPTSHAIQKDR